MDLQGPHRRGASALQGLPRGAHKGPEPRPSVLEVSRSCPWGSAGIHEDRQSELHRRIRARNPDWSCRQGTRKRRGAPAVQGLLTCGGEGI